MPWIEINGAALRYEEAGAGDPALVLVHEMGGTLESFDAILPALASRRRVIRYDTRGAGLSEKLRGTADIDELADDVAGLLDALGVRGPVAIAGVAVGGAIAIHFAARHAKRTAALIATSPATGVSAERRAATFALADQMEAHGIRFGIEDAMAKAYPEHMRGDRRRFGEVHGQRLGNDPASQAAIYRMLIGLDMTGDFARISCPTLIIAGKHDGLRPPSMIEPIARAIKGARYEVLDSAHFMPAQTPELVAASINRFLADAGC